MKLENKKEKIIKTLTDFGKLPTAKLSAIVGINYYKLKEILEELESENKIIKTEAGELATYWELNLEDSHGKEIQN